MSTRDDDDLDRPRRRKASGWSTGKVVLAGCLGCGGLTVLLCAGIGFWAYQSVLAPTTFSEQKEDYAQARQGFQTKLVRRGPAPQQFDRDVPPVLVKVVDYTSGGLRLSAWVDDPSIVDSATRPAVLFLHGGFAFGIDDWEMTKPFRDVGFVVMTPMLRGENGQPGDYTMFYDEVNDVLAAAEVLAKMPHVDSKHMYVAGHSAGGTLTLLAAMTSNRFRAAASFSGAPDQKAFARFNQELVPFDQSNPREFEMRSALAFPTSFKCPVRLYYGSEELAFRNSSQKTAELARAAKLDVEAVSIPGDHFSSVPEGIRRCIEFFRKNSQ